MCRPHQLTSTLHRQAQCQLQPSRDPPRTEALRPRDQGRRVTAAAAALAAVLRPLQVAAQVQRCGAHALGMPQHALLLLPLLLPPCLLLMERCGALCRLGGVGFTRMHLGRVEQHQSMRRCKCEGL